LNSRVGGGLGSLKATIFTEESERVVMLGQMIEIVILLKKDSVVFKPHWKFSKPI
jgi:hypothetical protein